MSDVETSKVFNLRTLQCSLCGPTVSKRRISPRFCSVFSGGSVGYERLQSVNSDQHRSVTGE